MRPIALLFPFVLLACQSTQEADTGAKVGETSAVSASGDVTLTLDATTYKPSAEVRMTIASRARDNLGYNPCGNRVIERQAGTSWVLHPEPDRVCTMEIRFLRPGETVAATTSLPADLSPGTYRIVLTLTPETGGGSPVRAISPTFRVE